MQRIAGSQQLRDPLCAGKDLFVSSTNFCIGAIRGCLEKTISFLAPPVSGIDDGCDFSNAQLNRRDQAHRHPDDFTIENDLTVVPDAELHRPPTQVALYAGKTG
jgi:hypothetical protein